MSSLVSFQEKSSSSLPQGPFSTSHTLSSCPGDKDIQTNPDISLAGLILNLILLSAEKPAPPLSTAPSPAPLARDAAKPPGCPGSNQANSRDQENTLLSCFPSPSCPGTQCSGRLWPVTCIPRPPLCPHAVLPACRGISTSLQEPHPFGSWDTPISGFPGTKLMQLLNKDSVGPQRRLCWPRDRPTASQRAGAT